LDAKDTLREFKGYVEEFDVRKREGRLRYPGNAAYEEDDNEDGEEDYVESDVGMVRTCLLLFDCCREAMVCGLKALTFIGDHISNESLEAHEVINGQQWIARCSNDTKTLLNFITNVGAELYPPLVAEDISLKFEEARVFALQYLGMLSDSHKESYDTDLRDTIDSLLSNPVLLKAIDFTAI
jgi:hypothetical protein